MQRRKGSWHATFETEWLTCNMLILRIGHRGETMIVRLHSGVKVQSCEIPWPAMKNTEVKPFEGKRTVLRWGAATSAEAFVFYRRKQGFYITPFSLL